MIVDERISTYINSLDKGNSEFLNELRRQAMADDVPIIRQETEKLLKVLIRMKQPERILEVGTAVGYSALVMAAEMPETSTVTTIEKYEKRIPIARENFSRAGETRITLLEGDAAEVLKELKGSYDFIFMDAAKGQYLHFFPEIMRLLAAGGVLVSDNVLQDGEIIESHFLVARRNRTIYGRMREYLYTLTHHTALQTAVVPIGDGITISTKLADSEAQGKESL